MVLFRGDIKCRSLQRRTSISVILPADNLHFLNDTEDIVEKPYKTLYLLHGLYGSDDIFLANTSIQKFAEDNGIAIVIPCGENSFYLDDYGSNRLFGEYVGQELLDITRNIFPLSDKREEKSSPVILLNALHISVNRPAGMRSLSNASISKSIRSASSSACDAYSTGSLTLSSKASHVPGL